VSFWAAGNLRMVGLPRERSSLHQARETPKCSGFVDWWGDLPEHASKKHRGGAPVEVLVYRLGIPWRGKTQEGHGSQRLLTTTVASADSQREKSHEAEKGTGRLLGVAVASAPSIPAPRGWVRKRRKTARWHSANDELVRLSGRRIPEGGSRKTFAR
jgi:hypothetical protein